MYARVCSRTRFATAVDCSFSGLVTLTAKPTFEQSLGVHISFVRSITMDSWKDKEVAMMRQGGNGKLRAFFDRREIPSSLRISAKYNTPDAAYFREKLKAEVGAVLGGAGLGRARLGWAALGWTVRLGCAVPCRAVPCRAGLGCAVRCRAGVGWAGLCRAALCCAVGPTMWGGRGCVVHD